MSDDPTLTWHTTACVLCSNNCGGDPIAGTPWHKHVPARFEVVEA